MTPRFAFLALIALAAMLLAPLRVLGGEAAAMPHHGASAHRSAPASEHCPSAPADDAIPGADCMTACSAIAAPAPAALPGRYAPAEAPARQAVNVIRGLVPEAEPRPPRFS